MNESPRDVNFKRLSPNLPFSLCLSPVVGERTKNREIIVFNTRKDKTFNRRRRRFSCPYRQFNLISIFLSISLHNFTRSPSKGLRKLEKGRKAYRERFWSPSRFCMSCVLYMLSQWFSHFVGHFALFFLLSVLSIVCDDRCDHTHSGSLFLYPLSSPVIWRELHV